jgi:hypothetical protein
MRVNLFNTGEDFTIVTLALTRPLFPVNIIGSPINFDSVTLTATGGIKYSWNGGISRTSATNTFYTSGTYFLTATDGNGSTVTTSKTTIIEHKTSSVNSTICHGQDYFRLYYHWNIH